MTDLNELAKLFPKKEKKYSGMVKFVPCGEWISKNTEDGEFWANYCSKCKAYLPYGIEWKPNYCPNCGAQMGSIVIPAEPPKEES